MVHCGFKKVVFSFNAMGWERMQWRMHGMWGRKSGGVVVGEIGTNDGETERCGGQRQRQCWCWKGWRLRG